MPYLLLALWVAVQSGPVGYWNGDDGASPTTAADSSGFGNNGTYMAGATTSSAVPALQFPNNRSMSFNSPGAHVDIPGFPWPTGGPVTVAYWSFIGTAQVRNSSAFRVGTLEVPNRFHAHAPWGDSVVYWDYGDYNEGRLSTSYAAFLDKWTHVVLVSGGNGGSFQGIYLDGILQASDSITEGPDVPLTGLAIGRWDATLYFQGLIDDFRIYDRVLTPAQITMLAGGFTEPAAPAALTATGGTLNIQLNWSVVGGATSYNVKRSLVAGGPYVIISAPAGTSTTDAAVTPGTSYFYVVTAVGISESGPSNEVGAVPLSATFDLVIEGCGGLGLEGLLLAALIRAALRTRAAARRPPA